MVGQAGNSKWGGKYTQKCNSPGRPKCTHKPAPILEARMKCYQLWDLGLDGDGHVILDGVQGSEDEIEDAYRIP